MGYEYDALAVSSFKFYRRHYSSIRFKRQVELLARRQQICRRLKGCRQFADAEILLEKRRLKDYDYRKESQKLQNWRNNVFY